MPFNNQCRISFFLFILQNNQHRKDRCFGEYKCPKCSRKWMSGYSWKDVPQQCERCRIDVIAHTQSPLRTWSSSDDRNKSDPNKEHRSDLCGMCQQLGHKCTYYD